MSLIGIPLGIFIGILSGFVFLLIVKIGFQSAGVAQIGKILSGLAALVSFSLGGSWFTNSYLLKDAESSEILSYYMLAFSMTFLVVVAIPLYRLIIRFGKLFAEMDATPMPPPEPENAEDVS